MFVNMLFIVKCCHIDDGKCRKVLISEALAAVSCVCWLKDLRNKNVFSVAFKTDSESLPMTDTGSEFQRDGTDAVNDQWYSRRT